MDFELKHTETTERIIGCFYTVYNTLGFGFTEAIYHEALTLELRDEGLEVMPEAPLTITYRGEAVGHHRVDLLVDNIVLVEVKAARDLVAQHRAQLLSYLKASRYEVGLLLNFGPSPKIERRVFDNARKGSLCWTRRASRPYADDADERG